MFQKIHDRVKNGGGGGVKEKKKVIDPQPVTNPDSSNVLVRNNNLNYSYNSTHHMNF